MIGEIAKLMASIGNAVTTKRINDQARDSSDSFYKQQQGRIDMRRNRDAMDDTEARVAMGAIDQSEQRAQKRERNMRNVVGGTDMSSVRAKQAASDSRADAASAIHARKQADRQVYDQMYENSKEQQYRDEQKRLQEEKQSAQIMYQNAMSAAGAAAGGLVGMLNTPYTPDTTSAGEVKDDNIGKEGYNGNGTRGGKVQETTTGGGVDANGNPTKIETTISATPVVADTSGLHWENNPYYGMSPLKARMLAKRAASK